MTLINIPNYSYNRIKIGIVIKSYAAIKFNDYVYIFSTKTFLS